MKLLSISGKFEFGMRREDSDADDAPGTHSSVIVCSSVVLDHRRSSVVVVVVVVVVGSRNEWY